VHALGDLLDQLRAERVEVLCSTPSLATKNATFSPPNRKADKLDRFG